MINVLASTTETQGQRENDFCFVPEGELVKIGISCDRDACNPDGECGCARALCGFNCHQATTTFKVIEADMTIAEYTDMYTASVKDEYGFAAGDMRFDDAIELLAAANSYPVGSVLEYRAGLFAIREL